MSAGNRVKQSSEATPEKRVKIMIKMVKTVKIASSYLFKVCKYRIYKDNTHLSQPRPLLHRKNILISVIWGLSSLASLGPSPFAGPDAAGCRA